MACDGPSRAPTGAFPLRNVTSTLATMVLAEFQIADAPTVIGGGVGRATKASADLGGGHRGLALGEDPGLRGTDARHVTDGIDVGDVRLQGQRIHRYPAVDR